MEEDSNLIAIDTKDVMGIESINAIKNVVELGKKQYKTYVEDRLIKRSTPITAPLKKNNLPLFSFQEKDQPKHKAKIAELKNDCALFSRLYIACQSRDGNLEEFFQHENQPWPPSPGEGGELRKDSRIMLHLYEASLCGYRRMMIRSIDTDVLVLALSAFHTIAVEELWIAFGTGKHFKYIPIHETATKLGSDRCKALPLFHAITGCDTGRGKKTAWDIWNSYPNLTPVLLNLTTPPPSSTDIDEVLPVIERFVVLLYDKASVNTEDNVERQHLFAQKSRSIDAISPSQAALKQHILRAVYQGAVIWGQALVRKPNVPSPDHWGWMRNGNAWNPLWTTISQAKDSCYELIHCGCKKGCRVYIPDSEVTVPHPALTAHNRYRNIHHSPALNWSDSLASQAQIIADNMAGKGSFSTGQRNLALNLGQNLAKLAGQMSCEDAGEIATNLWYSQAKNYSYSDPRLNADTDTFTQIVWKSSKEIGVGCARASELTGPVYIVALYRPAGNIPRVLHDNVLSPGAKGKDPDVYSTLFRRHFKKIKSRRD